jgi:hypothetical protein
MTDKKLQEGLESIQRSKLLMGYNMSKTLTENLNEQSKTTQAPKVPEQLKDITARQGLTFNQGPRPETSKNNWEKDKKEYQSENPDMVWDPNAYDTTKPGLDKYGKTVYPKGKWVKMIPSNVGLRGTPFGFHPSEYPEYLKKVAEIKKKYPEEETTWYNPMTWIDSDNDEKREKELEKLKSQYYHEDYPEGITKNDFIRYNKGKANLSAEKIKSLKALNDELSKINYQTPQTNPGSDYFLTLHNQQVNQAKMAARSNLNLQYQNLNDYFDIVFGRDPTAIDQVKYANRSQLEKFWDDWGDWLELAALLAADYFSAGIAAELTGTRQSVVLAKTIGKIANGLKKLGPVEKMAKIVKYAGSSGLPLAMGGYYLLKEKKLTENSLIWFIFATLPFAHSYYESLKGITPTKEICNSIIQRMSKYNLKNPKELKSFIKSLTEEQKTLVRAVWTMNKNEVKNGVQKTADYVGRKNSKKIVNLQKRALKGGRGLIEPSVVKILGKTILTLGSIFVAINVIENAAIKFGVIADPKIIQEIKQKFKIISDAKKENPIYVLSCYLEILKYLEENKQISTSNEVIDTAKENTEKLLKLDEAKITEELKTSKQHFENLGLVNDSMFNEIPAEELLKTINN